MRILIILSILISSMVLAYNIYTSLKQENLYSHSNTEKIDIAKIKSGEVSHNSPKRVNLKEEFILGSKDADIFIIEYFDMESDKSAKFFDDLKKLENKWASTGHVAFVFRPFPLKQFEKKYGSAFLEAKAVVCVGKNLGIEKMQILREKIYSETKFDGKFSKDRLMSLAGKLVANQDEFSNCIEDKQVDAILESSRAEAINAGAVGTPSVYLQFADGQILPTPADFETIEQSLESYFQYY